MLVENQLLLNISVIGIYFVENIVPPPPPHTHLGAPASDFECMCVFSKYILYACGILRQWVLGEEPVYGLKIQTVKTG